MDAGDALERALQAARARLSRRPLRLPGAFEIEPYAQGELDGLCGLYTTVNALRLEAAAMHKPLTEGESHRLFQHGVAFLHEQGKLSAALRYGLRWRLWIKLVDHLNGKAERMIGRLPFLQRPFDRMAEMHPSVFISMVREGLRDRKAVLVLLKGSYDHYTVICGLSDTRLILFDSYGYRWITIRACATMAEMPGRHRIHIPSIMLLGG